MTIPVFVVLSASALVLASAIAGDKVVPVSAQDALAHPSAVERQLAEEGIEAQVQVVPVKDALVGKWFHLYLDPTTDVDAETFALLNSYVGEIDYRYESVAEHCGPTAALCERTSILEIPGSVTGPMTLVVGRAAKPGEEYWARNMDWSNELAPSGALYCYALEEKTADAARDVLQRAGYEVVFNYDVKSNSTEVASIPPDAALTSATFRDVDTVVLNFAPIQEEPGYPSAGEQRLAMGTPTEQTGRPNFRGC
ncbi:MAG: hypothetical protein M3N53_06020 [Actinomycetota bacterium]|nr:hypothetical protein [Actinomycetota bacterium]